MRNKQQKQASRLSDKAQYQMETALAYLHALHILFDAQQSLGAPEHTLFNQVGHHLGIAHHCLVLIRNPS